MKKRYALTYFLDADYKAMEDWLNRKADRGWELERLRLGLLAVFVPRTHPEVTYAVDLAPIRRDEEEEETYRQLCADAGWELVGKAGAKRVYRSVPGRDTIPLQTDLDLEEKQFRACITRPELSGAMRTTLLVVFLTWLSVWSNSGAIYWFELALEPMVLAVLALIALELLWHLAMVFYAWRYSRRICRAEERGEPFPRPRLGRARLRGYVELTGLVMIVCLAVLYVPFSFSDSTRFRAPVDQAQELGVITVADLGYRNASDDTLWLEGGDILKSVSIIQSTGPSGVLYSERFDSRWPWLARQVFRELRDQESRDSTRKICCGNGESTALPVPVSGAEEAVLLQCERGQYFILRQGNTVLRLMGNLDFTEEAVLATIEENMQKS